MRTIRGKFFESDAALSELHWADMKSRIRPRGGEHSAFWKEQRVSGKRSLEPCL